MTPAAKPVRRAPRVTVLMSVYNGGDFLRQALESVLHQSYRDLELVVVDDASTDDSGTIIRSYRDPRVRVLTNPRNLGLAKSLNRGLATARGELVARQDADDVSYPERIERQVRFLDAHPRTALVGTAYDEIDEAGRRIRTKILPTDPLELRWILLFQNAFMHASVIVRTSALRVVGGYDPLIGYAEDYDLWSRISWQFEVANLSDVLASYRLSRHSMTSLSTTAAQEVYTISGRNVRRLSPRPRQTVGAPRFDVEAAQRLLFGREARVTRERARETSRETLELQAAFARLYGVPGRVALRHRAGVAARLARSVASLAAERREPAAYLDAASLLATACRHRAQAAAAQDPASSETAE